MFAMHSTGDTMTSTRSSPVSLTTSERFPSHIAVGPALQGMSKLIVPFLMLVGCVTPPEDELSVEESEATVTTVCASDTTLTDTRGVVDLVAFTQYVPFDAPNTDRTRDAWAKKVIAAIGAYAPDLASLVEHVEVLTPRDLEDRFGLLGGNIMQGELTPDQLFSFRPIPFYGDYRTPINGLYLCGAGTHPGGGVMGIPGRNASTVMLKDVRRDRVIDRARRLVSRG